MAVTMMKKLYENDENYGNDDNGSGDGSAGNPWWLVQPVKNMWLDQPVRCVCVCVSSFFLHERCDVSLRNLGNLCPMLSRWTQAG